MGSWPLSLEYPAAGSRCPQLLEAGPPWLQACAWRIASTPILPPPIGTRALPSSGGDTASVRLCLGMIRWRMEVLAASVEAQSALRSGSLAVLELAVGRFALY